MPPNKTPADFYIISKEKVITQTENAKKFLTAVEEYINTKLSKEAEQQ